MAEKDYILKFYHKGEFMKTTYVGGTTSEVPKFVDADKMSYSVVMEYVKELEYTEIGGLYVKMVPHGWYLISNDNDLIRFIDGVKGDKLEFYIDTVVDKSIQPREEMQPHVIVRPRTQFFKGNLFYLFLISMLSKFTLTTNCTNRFSIKAYVCDHTRAAKREGKGKIGR